jgi:hypothetical protein
MLIVLSSVLLALALPAQAPEPALPEAYWAIPIGVRDQATVVFSGRYRSGRGPCEWLADGSRRWALLQGVSPEITYRGDLHTDYVGLGDPHVFALEGEGASLVEGHAYLVLLRPSEHSTALLREPAGSRRHQDALAGDEVLAIVEQTRSANAGWRDGGR